MVGNHDQEQMWRREYGAKRYARHLSAEELNQRLRDIFLNMFELSEGAKVSLSSLDSDKIYWLELFTHTLEEIQLRYGPYPAGIPDNLYPNNEFFPNIEQMADRAAKALVSCQLERNNVLIKFGKQKHMENLYNNGSLRIQPASFYSEKEHNGAIHDDELAMALSLVLSPDEIRDLVINPQDVSDKACDQRVNLNINSPNNYWLYCLTSSVNSRMFLDFEADACVVIKDRGAFSERLQEKSFSGFSGVIMNEGFVNYIDPLLPETVRIHIPLVKHFRYSYQNEYRFYWMSPEKKVDMQHLDIELGSLEDIAELIVI